MPDLRSSISRPLRRAGASCCPRSACAGNSCLPKSTSRARAGEGAAAYVTRLSIAKAREAQSRAAGRRMAPVVAADTAVVIGGELLGKPASEDECRRMLGLLSGKVHEVYTAVAVISMRGESVAVCRSEVAFREIGAEEIAAYWRSGEPADKAGGYGIQGRGGYSSARSAAVTPA